MTDIALHRYSPAQEPGDLTREDLLVLWGLLKDEGLVDCFFHDGRVRAAEEFLTWAMDGAQWVHAARRKGEWICMGVVNGFSARGRTAFTHFVVFACGRRDGAHIEAARMWHELMSNAGLLSVVGVIPACYRATRKFVHEFGYVERMRLPEAFVLSGRHEGRVTDAVVTQYMLR